MKKKDKYILSIIICCYNSAKFIDKTIKSLKNLDSNNIEVVFVNDGSTDNTKEKLASHSKRKNFKIINQVNKGLAECRNVAINNSSAEWITILDHDDLFTHDRIIFCNNFIINLNHFDNKKIYFANCHIVKYDETILRFNDNHPIKKNKINLNKKYCYYELLKYGCFLVSSTVLFNRNIFNQIGPFNKNFQITCDFDFFIRSSIYYDFEYIDKIFCEWIESSTQLTSKKNIILYDELINIYHREIIKKSLLIHKYFFIYKNFIKYHLKKLIIKIHNAIRS